LDIMRNTSLCRTDSALGTGWWRANGEDSAGFHSVSLFACLLLLLLLVADFRTG
jgi:hypothetical protein